MSTSFVEYIEGSDVPHVPEGRYVAQLVGVEPAKTRFGDSFRWHWVLPVAGNFELTQMTSTATTGGSNAGKNIRALRGKGLAPGERLVSAEIVGKRVTLEVSVTPESGWNRVEDVFPMAAQLSPETVDAYAAEADAEAPKPGSAAAMQARLARQQAEAQAATFHDDSSF